MNLTQEDIKNFLYFGYSVKPEQIDFPFLFDVSQVIKNTRENLPSDYDSLVVSGISAFEQAFDNLASIDECQKNIVSLSGGLDSRAILGFLLSRYDTSQICVFTYGVEGSYDFEIAKKITNKFGVKHDLINLSYEVDWSEECLVDFAIQKNLALPVVSSYINNLVYRQYGKSPKYWSGFMGDPVAGSHLRIFEHEFTWSKAVESFISQGNKFSKKLNVLPKWIPNKPLIDKKYLTYGEQLDFAIRQNVYVKNGITNSSYKNIFPFIDKSIAGYMLSVPNKYRDDTILYKNILFSSNSALFSLPSKTMYNTTFSSSVLRRKVQKKYISLVNKISASNPYFHVKNPFINTLPYNEYIRTSKTFRTLIKKQLNDLSKRDIISSIDIDNIFSSHINRKKNNYRIILSLTNLELNLKAGNLKVE